MLQILLLSVVGGEALEIADVDFEAADDEVDPGGTSAYLHLVHEFEPCWAGVDEKEEPDVVRGSRVP